MPDRLSSALTTTCRRTALILAGSIGVLLVGQSAQAASVTWVGNTSNLWNTGANWSTAGVPINGDTLVFGTPGSVGLTGATGVALSDDITSLTVGGAGTDGIVYGPSAGIYAITRPAAQTITLGSSAGGIAVKNTSNFFQSLAVPMTSASAQTVQVGNTTGAALSALTTGTGGWIGGFRLTKTGTGVLTLGNSNLLSGLTVNQGTVSIANDTQLSAAPGGATPGWIVLNGGTLRTSVNASFTLNANRGIALGDATANSGGTLNVFSTGGAAPFTLTYNGIIANNGGTNSLTKTGFNILSLGGANTYTGATKINQGQMTLDFTAAGAPTSDIISSSSNLVMGDVPTSLSNTTPGSPILFVQGSNTTTTTQTFTNGAVINRGNANIVARGGSSTFNTTLELRALTHTAGGTVGFSLLTGGSTGAGITTTTTGNTNNILGGWATTAGAAVAGTAPLTQTDWAANDGSGNIVAYSGYTDFVTAGAVTSSATSNFRITGGSTGNPTLGAGTTDLNTIQATDPLARIIAVGSGNTLRLGNFGGVWKSAAANTSLTIGTSVALGGTLTAGGAATTPGEIVFNTNGASSTNNTIVVNSVIADNGVGGTVNVVKTGIAGLTLNAANTFTGGMIINQGAVNANAAGAFGGSGRNVTVMPGGSIALAVGGGLTYANNFNLAATSLTMGGTFSAGVVTVVGNTVGGTVTLLGDTTIGSSGTNGTITGQITGDYSLSFIGHATLSNSGNDFSGNFGVNGLNGPLGGNIVTVKLGANEVLPDGVGKGNVIISGSGTTGNLTTLDLNGRTETINGLISVENINSVLSDPDIPANSRITNTAGTAATLILGGNDQTATFGGTIVDGSVSGTVAITKIGAGRQTFSGSNTYTGETSVTGGVLNVTGSLANNGSNKVFVDSPDATTAGNPVLTRGRASASSYAGFGATAGIVGGPATDTKADLLGGTNSTGTDIKLSMAFRDALAGDTAAGIKGSILALTDMANSGGASGQTDVFVLQLSYDEAALGATEASLTSTAGLYLAYYTGSAWDNAIVGNFGSNTGATNLSGSWASNGSSLTLGSWGVDTTSNNVWAVVNHNTDFGVVAVIPEPSSWTMLVGGIGALLAFQRSRRRAA